MGFLNSQQLKPNFYKSFCLWLISLVVFWLLLSPLEYDSHVPVTFEIHPQTTRVNLKTLTASAKVEVWGLHLIPGGPLVRPVSGPCSAALEIRPEACWIYWANDWSKKHGPDPSIPQSYFYPVEEGGLRFAYPPLKQMRFSRAMKAGKSPKIYFWVFGYNEFEKHVDRSVVEAAETGLFDGIFWFKDVPPEIKNDRRWSRHLQPRTRSYGWEFWKPALNLWILQQGIVEEEDIVVYADAGSVASSRIFSESSKPEDTAGYLSDKYCDFCVPEMTQESSKCATPLSIVWADVFRLLIGYDIVGTGHLCGGHHERVYTKGDLLFGEFGHLADSVVSLSGQVVGGYLFYKVTNRSRRFLHEWERLMADVHLASDYPSVHKKDYLCCFELVNGSFDGRASWAIGGPSAAQEKDKNGKLVISVERIDSVSDDMFQSGKIKVGDHIADSTGTFWKVKKIPPKSFRDVRMDQSSISLLAKEILFPQKFQRENSMWKNPHEVPMIAVLPPFDYPLSDTNMIGSYRGNNLEHKIRHSWEILGYRMLKTSGVLLSIPKRWKMDEVGRFEDLFSGNSTAAYSAVTKYLQSACEWGVCS